MPQDFNSLIQIAKTIINYIIIIANLVVAGMLVFHGVHFAQGNQEAGGKLVKAIVGLIIVNIVYFVVFLILQTTGMNDVATALR